MNLNQLRVFKLAVERGGMSAAARELKLSPTAVSKQIKSLEALLGTQLIKRSSTDFTMTEAGTLFYENCQKILRDVDGLSDVVRSFNRAPSGNLKVFATQAFAERFITPYLNEFFSQYPGVLLNLDIADRFPDLKKEGFDLCLGLTTHWDGDLIKKKLLKVSACLVAAPAYLKRYGTPKSFEDLLKHRFVAHGGRPDPNTISFNGGESVHVRPILLVNDHSTLLACAVAGLGVIYSFDMIAQPFLDRGELSYAFPKANLGTETYYAFYPPTRHLKPAARALLDFILSKLPKK